MKPIQFFSEEYLEQCHGATPKQVLTFLENYRQMQAIEDKSKLISIKIPHSMLATFRQKCELHGLKYQTQIKKLMKDWLA